MERNVTLTSLLGESSSSSCHGNKVISAEIKMAQFIVMHNLSFQSSDHLSDLFSSMFPDSKIAASFSCKHTKTKSIICDAIDPHLKKLIIECVRCSPFHLLCDESNERGATVKLLTVLNRFFEPQKEVVATRHLDTVGIIDLSDKGIYDSIKSLLEKYKLPFCNLLSFTSDTCNTMKGTRGGVISKLRVEQPKIVDVYCNCYLINLCVKAATKTMPLKIDEILIDIYYHFHRSVKRITSLHDYAEFCSVEFKVASKLSVTRWLSLRHAIHTLEMWNPLYSYFCSHPDVEKSGKVKSIFEELQHPLTKVWFYFLSNVLPIFDKFNTSFQTSSTATVHKLYGETKRLLKIFCPFLLNRRLYNTTLKI